MRFCIGSLLRLGTDGKMNGYTPFGGDFKTLTTQISSSSSRAWLVGDTLLRLLGVRACLLRGGHVRGARLWRASGSAIPLPWPSLLSSPSALNARASASPRLEVSIASLVFVFAAVVFGPLAGVSVAAAGLLARSSAAGRRPAGLRWLTWTASRMIVAGAQASRPCLCSVPWAAASWVLRRGVGCACRRVCARHCF